MLLYVHLRATVCTMSGNLPPQPCLSDKFGVCLPCLRLLRTARTPNRATWLSILGMYVPSMLGVMMFLSHLILPPHKITLSIILLFRLLDMWVGLRARQEWLTMLYVFESGRTRPISLVSSDSLPFSLVGCQEAPRHYLTRFGATYPLDYYYY